MSDKRWILGGQLELAPYHPTTLTENLPRLTESSEVQGAVSQPLKAAHHDDDSTFCNFSRLS